MHHPLTMQAIELRAFDGTSLALVERPLPQPQRGQVLVRVAAAPINPSDQMFIRGLYTIPRTLPTIPGFEGSGVVVDSGGGLLADALVGRRCAIGGQAGDGTWAQYIAVPATTCVPLLPHVGLESGAMLLVNPLTAYALVDIAVQGGHRSIVQTAAAGALGRMISELARRRGLSVIEIVRRPEQVTQLRARGAQYVLDSSAADFDAQLRVLADRLDARIAFDAVAGGTPGQVLAAMPRGARVLVYGALAEEPVMVHPGELIFQNKRVEGFWLTDWIASKPLPAVMRAALDIQTRLVDATSSKIQARFSLAEFRAALDAYAANMSAGKVLLTP